MRCVIAIALLLLVAGCGDWESNSDALRVVDHVQPVPVSLDLALGGDADIDLVLADDGADADAGVDANAEPTPDFLKVRVVTTRYLRAWAAWDFMTLELEPLAPARGATVLFDRPDGQRVEDTTGATGRTMFDIRDVDWSAGPAAVTAHLPDHGLETWILDGPPSDELVLRVNALRPELVELVTVSGHAVNMAGTGDYFGVTPITPLSHWNVSDTPSFSAQVLAGHPLFLHAFQFDFEPLPPRGLSQSFSNHAVVAHEGAMEDVTDLVIDFDQHKLASETVSGSIALPQRLDSELRQSGWGFVGLYADSRSVFMAYNTYNALLGAATFVDYDPARNRFDYDLEYVDIPDSDDPFFRMHVYEGCCGRWTDHDGIPWMSLIYGFGVPEDDDEWAVVDLPEWDHGYSCCRRLVLDRPFEWVAHDDDVRAHIFLVSAQQNTTIWRLVAPEGAVSAQFPEPPAAARTDLIEYAVLRVERQLPEVGGEAAAISGEWIPVVASCY